MKIHLAPRSTLGFLVPIIVGCSTTPTPSIPAAGSAVSGVGIDPLASWNGGSPKKAIIGAAE